METCFFMNHASFIVIFITDRFYSSMVKQRVLFIFLCAVLFLAGCRKERQGSDNDYKTLGTSANELLSSAVYTTLKIEISYMPGYKPPEASINDLVLFLEKYLNKPGGIQIAWQAIAANGKPFLTLNDVVNIERKSRLSFTDGNTLAVHVLFTDAAYANPDNLALSYWNTSICLFGKAIESKLTGITSVGKSNVYSTLLQHEFGHLLGLVGQGSPQQVAHRDDDNGAHCANKQCLMYYQIETNVPSLNVPQLDAHCISDLKANGAK